MKVSKSSLPSTVTFKTKDSQLANLKGSFKWWLAKDKRMLKDQVLMTAQYLKETQSYLFRQTAIWARLYGNMSLFSFIGSNISKMDTMTGLPIDRPTFNLIQSCVDTVVSRLSQNKPSPVFLTEAGDYKERHLAEQMNKFIQGEFYQTKAYDKATMLLRDTLVTGTGVLKIYETTDHKVALDRALKTELLVDPNDSMYMDPRQLLQLKLVDRDVLMDQCSGYRAIIEAAEVAYPDNSAESSKTISDQIMVVEAWHLPSGPDATDGRHVLACSSGVLVDEKFNKERFPFVWMHYSPRMLGFWSQGMAEQLMGTQVEINSLLYTISKAIKLVGVPRVFVEAGSKVTKASFNDDMGTIIEYRGTKPSYEVAPCVPQELYTQLQRLIEYGYQQCGVSALQASSQKPAGLNSGEAIRSYDDISTDRLAFTSRQYDNVFVDLTYAITDLAKDIAEREGKYQTVYPNKDGTKQIDLPKVSLIQDPFVVQVFNQSSLPKDPAGRMQKVTEMVQAGMITIKEGRRLLDYPDLDQVEKLANASEERIFQILDKIVEDGEYAPPDPFMDLQLANDLSVQYYNLYAAAKLEEDRCEMLRTFFNQVQTLKQAAMPPQMPQGGAPVPQGAPQPQPQSPLVPNTPGGP